MHSPIGCCTISVPLPNSSCRGLKLGQGEPIPEAVRRATVWAVALAVVVPALVVGSFTLLHRGIENQESRILLGGLLAGGALWILVAAGFVVTLSRRIAKSRRHAELSTERLTERRAAELERRTHIANLVSELADLLQSCQTIGEAGEVLGQVSQQLFLSTSGGLYVFAASRNELGVVAQWGASSVPFFAPGDCWALRRGNRRLWVPGDIGPRCPHVAPGAFEYVCVPMVAHGETVGLFHLWKDEKSAKGSGHISDESEIVFAVSEHVALAIANLQLRENLRNQSIRDPLTGLFNRRYMEESLDRELSRAVRHDLPIGVLMVDVDHFKDFNDRFGHESGDLALCKVADCLASRLRGEDIACRYGGEEFVLVLPGASGENAWKRAESLVEAMRALRVTPASGGAQQQVTISIGVSSYPEDGSESKELVRAADVALYRAKLTGRDRVVMSKREAPGDRPELST